MKTNGTVKLWGNRDPKQTSTCLVATHIQCGRVFVRKHNKRVDLSIVKKNAFNSGP